MNTLYYESHITVEPVFEERLEQFRALCKPFKFRVADLLMKKRKADTAERSQYDTFCTGRSDSFEELQTNMNGLLDALRGAEFKIWRYKIEAALIDVRL